MTHRYLVVALATLGFVTPSGAAQNRARVRKLVKQNRSSLTTQKRPAAQQPVKTAAQRPSSLPVRQMPSVPQRKNQSPQSAQINRLKELVVTKANNFGMQSPELAGKIGQLNPQDRDFLIKNLNKVTTQKMAENMVKWVAQKAAQPKAQNQTQPNVTPKNQAQQIKIKEMRDKIDQLTKEKDAAMEKATKEKADLEKKVEEARSSASGDSDTISNLRSQISTKYTAIQQLQAEKAMIGGLGDLFADDGSFDGNGADFVNAVMAFLNNPSDPKSSMDPSNLTKTKLDNLLKAMKFDGLDTIPEFDQLQTAAKSQKEDFTEIGQFATALDTVLTALDATPGPGKKIQNLIKYLKTVNSDDEAMTVANLAQFLGDLTTYTWEDDNTLTARTGNAGVQQVYRGADDTSGTVSDADAIAAVLKGKKFIVLDDDKLGKMGNYSA